MSERDKEPPNLRRKGYLNWFITFWERMTVARLV